MCNCFEEKTKELEKKMPEIIKEKDSQFMKLVHFWPRDIIVSFSDSETPPFSLHFEAVYDRKLKNGKIKEKKMPVNLTPSHCPLCGEKYPTSQ
jgi:hypothetical protein